MAEQEIKLEIENEKKREAGTAKEILLTDLAEQLKKDEEITFEHKQFNIEIFKHSFLGFEGNIYLTTDFKEDEEDCENILDGGICETENEITAIEFFLEIAIDLQLREEQFDNGSITGGN